MSKLGLTALAKQDQGETEREKERVDADESKTVSPKEFMKKKNPQSDIQRAVCLGYYLAQHRQTPHFKTKDLATLNVEAAGVKIGNLSQAVNNATKQSHYFAPAGKGNKQVTSHGEAVVDALPDQAAVKVVEANRPKKRKPAKKKPR